MLFWRRVDDLCSVLFSETILGTARGACLVFAGDACYNRCGYQRLFFSETEHTRMKFHADCISCLTQGALRRAASVQDEALKLEFMQGVARIMTGADP